MLTLLFGLMPGAGLTPIGLTAQTAVDRCIELERRAKHYTYPPYADIPMHTYAEETSQWTDFLELFTRDRTGRPLEVSDDARTIDEMLAVARRYWAADSATSELVLAYLIADGGTVRSLSVSMLPVATVLYRALSGRAGPLVHHYVRSESFERLAWVLSAAEKESMPGTRRFVLEKGCDAVWLLSAYYADARIQRVRPGMESVSHALRILYAAAGASQGDEARILVEAAWVMDPRNGLGIRRRPETPDADSTRRNPP